MKKKNIVINNIEMIMPFSVIKCIKYPANNDAFTEAIISAKNIPSEVLTSINDAKTVITVSTASAPKTIK